MRKLVNKAPIILRVWPASVRLIAVSIAAEEKPTARVCHFNMVILAHLSGVHIYPAVQSPAAIRLALYMFLRFLCSTAK